MDDRIKRMAYNLIHTSIRVKPGDKVYIHYTGSATEPLARQLIKETYAAGALPFPHYTNPRVEREMLMHCTEEQLKLMAETDAYEMSRMDCYLAVRCFRTEETLKGRQIDETLFAILRRDVLEEVSPRSSWRASKTFRIQLIKELGERALGQALAKAGVTDIREGGAKDA